MRIRRLLQVAVLGGAVGLVLVSALAATNAVPGSSAGRSTSAISVDNMKPNPQCNGITVTRLVAGVSGTSSGDLLLGTAAANTMSGSGGTDCIVGGGGNDTLTGGSGTDVCIGGLGTDVNGGGCETFIQ